MIEKLKKNKTLQNMYMYIRGLNHYCWNGGLVKTDAERIVKDYIKNHQVRNLYFASGEIYWSGWLHSDIYNGDVYIDAKKKLPIDHATFDNIYTHHFIEHITFEQLRTLFTEFYRILKPNGRMRIVTPGFHEIYNEYLKSAVSDKNTDLVNWYCKEDTYTHPMVYVNQEMRQKGEHIFIYDFDLLYKMLTDCGFKNIKQYEYSKSDSEVFSGLDSVHGYQFIDRISLCLECEK